MSANCDYVYVEGLRFRTRDVSVVWKDADGSEHLVTLAKSGTGRAKFDGDGIPLRLTPKDLKKMLKKGATIGVVVRTTGPDSTGGHREGVRLRLDPRCAEGRSGRRSFGKGVGAGALDGLPVETLRALAFEQLVTAPYGERNRGEAAERMLWSLGLLDDQSIALLLRDAGPGLLAASSRSSTPLELSSLLLSDERLVEKLIRDGKHTSIMLLEHNSTRPGYPLADSSARPAHVVLEEVALKILRGEPARSVGRLPEDPLDQYNHERGLLRMRAVGYVRDQEVLEGVLANDPDPSVRIVAIGQLTLWAREVTSGRPARQSIRDAVTGDPAPTVRLHALRRVDTDEDISWDDRETLVFDVALLDPDEHVRLKALELLETDSALLDVAVDTVVDPGTSRAARDMVFARMAAGSVPRRRAGIVAQTHTSRMRETRSTEGLTRAVAGSNNREMLERLVDTLGAPSSFSDLYAASDALRVVRVVLDNPAITDELYAKAFALSKELTTARDAAKLREEQDRAKEEEEQRHARLLSAYVDLGDDVKVGLRHARAGNMDKAVEFLSGKTLYAAAAGLSDARDIRYLWEYIQEKVHARDLEGVSELLRRNPATPADMLPLFDTALRRLKVSGGARWHGGLAIAEDPTSTSEDIAFVLSLASQAASTGRSLGWHHVLPVLMRHPNATQEQVDAAAALLESWRPGEPPPPNTPR